MEDTGSDADVYAEDFKFAIGDKIGLEIIRIVTFVVFFCIKFSLWYHRKDIFRHFGPLNAIYEKLGFILEFCDP